MSLLSIIAHHGYAISAIVLFFAAAGLPLPTSIVLLTAGAAAHDGVLHLGLLLPLVWFSAALGDTFLYLGGRYTGWWLLAWLCRISVNPEQCIFGAADYFYRKGPKTLLFAKFVPGLGSMAAPIAGSLHMKPWKFLRMDAMGALGYVSAWMLTGYVFSRFINIIIHYVQGAGHVVGVLLLLVAVGYGIMLLVLAIRARKYDQIERISAEGLRDRLQNLDPNRLVVIADVRSHGYYDPGMHRIKNSIRVEPHRLKEELVALREFMAPECEIYLYCSCIRDTTSARIAHMLEKENCKTQVIEGGLKAWIKAGGAVELVPEQDVQHLPKFE